MANALATDSSDHQTAVVHRWQVGQVEVVRIEDEDFALPADRPVPAWAVPALAPDTTQTRIAFSAHLLRDGDATIVVDPWLANDAPREQPDAAERAARLLGQMHDAGSDPDSVAFVVNTHFDGVGWNTRPSPDGGWEPTFPHARYLYPRAERDAWQAGRWPTGAASFALLDGRGLIDWVDPGALPLALSDHVALIDAPGHTVGHLAVEVRDGDELAIIAGHLVLNVFQVVDPTEAADLDAGVATASRRHLLDRLADRHGLLLTSLLGGPGGGRVVRDGTGYRLDP